MKQVSEHLFHLCFQTYFPKPRSFGELTLGITFYCDCKSSSCYHRGVLLSVGTQLRVLKKANRHRHTIGSVALWVDFLLNKKRHYNDKCLLLGYLTLP